jgi:hypothetical protein
MATTKTELYNNGTLVATKTAAPFNTFDWTPASGEVGTASLTVKRYEDGVLAATSAAVGGTVSGASSSTSPDQLTNAYAWYDADDNTNMTVDGSNNVTALVNKITSNAINSHAPAPTYDETNTRIVFSGTGGLKSNAGFSAFSRTANFHIFMVFNAGSIPTTGNRNSFSCNWLSSSDRLGIGLRDGKLVAGTYNGTTWNTKSVTFSDTTNLHLLEVKNIGGVVTAYVDHVEMTDTGAPAPAESENRFTLGGVQQQSDYKFEQFVSASAEITGSEYTGIKQWFTDKYGL